MCATRLILHYLQLTNVLLTYAIWHPADKYVTSLLTHDLAFKVEPEKSSHKCYTELFFVRLLVCLTQMSTAPLILLFYVNNPSHNTTFTTHSNMPSFYCHARSRFSNVYLALYAGSMDSVSLILLHCDKTCHEICLCVS